MTDDTNMTAMDRAAANELAELSREMSDDTPHHVRVLPCPLTPEELSAMGDEIDALISSIEDLEAAKKSSASDYKARIDSATEHLQRLSKQRRGRVIEREVEVSITTDLSRAEEVVVRLDTGEVTSRRTLTRREIEEARQLSLPSASPTGHPAPTEESEPWSTVPAELADLMIDVDNADLDDTTSMQLQAMIAYAKETGIPPTDERCKTIASELARRKRGARKARGNNQPDTEV